MHPIKRCRSLALVVKKHSACKGEGHVLSKIPRRTLPEMPMTCKTLRQFDTHSSRSLLTMQQDAIS